MSGERLIGPVAKVLEAAHQGWNGYNRQPVDLYAHLADALVSACLVQSPETAADLEWLRARVAELEAGLAEYERPADEVPIRYALTEKAEDVSPQVAKLRALLAGRRAAVEDPHDSPLRHDYRLPRDLPATAQAGDLP